MAKKPPSKLIKALLPKGFDYAVEESIGLPTGVICCVNDHNQKLYLLVATEDEILREGVIFEILSPKDLKTYGIKNIAETYNQQLAKKEGFYVEESASADEDDDGFEEGLPSEALEAIKKRKEKRGQVVINISGQKGNEGENAEDDLSEGFKELLRVKCDENEVEYKEPKTLIEYRKLLKKVQKAEEKLQAEQDADPHGQSGTAPLTNAQDSRFRPNKRVSSPEDLKNKLLTMEFDSSKDMIDTLHEVERMASNPKEKKVSHDLLTKLLVKSMKIRENPNFRGFSLEGKKSAKEILEGLNDEIRQKRRLKRGEED